ncbi:MAG: hypothetical protein WCQ95_01780 [Bacteroidota bacterium]
MKYFFVFITVALLAGCCLNSSTEPKIKYSGYHIPVQGGRIDMKLDSVTPMLELIPQLDTNHEFYETHKGYWIGYNDLMFSIAVYSDKAIEPLINFIDTTRSFESKIAALYTLHLIGINCKIEGIVSEDFTNIKARGALLKLLSKNDSLQTAIMLLLIRDPRESDIPVLFDIMNSTKSDCWPITSGLLRYDLKNIPVNQTIPTELLLKTITLDKKVQFPDNEIMNETFKKLSNKYGDLIIVEDTLYNYNFQMPVRFGIDNNEISIKYLKDFCSATDFCFIAPNFQYYYKDGKLKFCSAMTTKNIWLNWWKSQSNSYKDSLKNSYKKIGRNII